MNSIYRPQICIWHSKPLTTIWENEEPRDRWTNNQHDLMVISINQNQNQVWRSQNRLGCNIRRGTIPDTIPNHVQWFTSKIRQERVLGICICGWSSNSRKI